MSWGPLEYSTSPLPPGDNPSYRQVLEYKALVWHTLESKGLFGLLKRIGTGFGTIRGRGTIERDRFAPGTVIAGGRVEVIRGSLGRVAEGPEGGQWVNIEEIERLQPIGARGRSTIGEGVTRPITYAARAVPRGTPGAMLGPGGVYRARHYEPHEIVTRLQGATPEVRKAASPTRRASRVDNFLHISRLIDWANRPPRERPHVEKPSESRMERVRHAVYRHIDPDPLAAEGVRLFDPYRRLAEGREERLEKLRFTIGYLGNVALQPFLSDRKFYEEAARMQRVRAAGGRRVRTRAPESPEAAARRTARLTASAKKKEEAARRSEKNILATRHFARGDRYEQYPGKDAPMLDVSTMTEEHRGKLVKALEDAIPSLIEEWSIRYSQARRTKSAYRKDFKEGTAVEHVGPDITPDFFSLEALENPAHPVHWATREGMRPGEAAKQSGTMHDILKDIEVLKRAEADGDITRAYPRLHPVVRKDVAIKTGWMFLMGDDKQVLPVITKQMIQDKDQKHAKRIATISPTLPGTAVGEEGRERVLPPLLGSELLLRAYSPVGEGTEKPTSGPGHKETGGPAGRVSLEESAAEQAGLSLLDYGPNHPMLNEDRAIFVGTDVDGRDFVRVNDRNIPIVKIDEAAGLIAVRAPDAKDDSRVRMLTVMPDTKAAGLEFLDMGELTGEQLDEIWTPDLLDADERVLTASRRAWRNKHYPAALQRRQTLLGQIAATEETREIPAVKKLVDSARRSSRTREQARDKARSNARREITQKVFRGAVGSRIKTHSDDLKTLMYGKDKANWPSTEGAFTESRKNLRKAKNTFREGDKGFDKVRAEAREIDRVLVSLEKIKGRTKGPRQAETIIRAMRNRGLEGRLKAGVRERARQAREARKPDDETVAGVLRELGPRAADEPELSLLEIEANTLAVMVGDAALKVVDRRLRRLQAGWDKEDSDAEKELNGRIRKLLTFQPERVKPTTVTETTEDLERFERETEAILAGTKLPSRPEETAPEITEAARPRPATPVTGDLWYGPREELHEDILQAMRRKPINAPNPDIGPRRPDGTYETAKDGRWVPEMLDSAGSPSIYRWSRRGPEGAVELVVEDADVYAKQRDIPQEKITVARKVRTLHYPTQSEFDAPGSNYLKWGEDPRVPIHGTLNKEKELTHILLDGRTFVVKGRDPRNNLLAVYEGGAPEEDRLIYCVHYSVRDRGLGDYEVLQEVLGHPWYERDHSEIWESNKYPYQLAKRRLSEGKSPFILERAMAEYHDRTIQRKVIYGDTESTGPTTNPRPIEVALVIDSGPDDPSPKSLSLKLILPDDVLWDEVAESKHHIPRSALTAEAGAVTYKEADRAMVDFITTKLKEQGLEPGTDLFISVCGARFGSFDYPAWQEYFPETAALINGPPIDTNQIFAHLDRRAGRPMVAFSRGVEIAHFGMHMKRREQFENNYIKEMHLVAEGADPDTFRHRGVNDALLARAGYLYVMGEGGMDEPRRTPEMIKQSGIFALDSTSGPIIYDDSDDGTTSEIIPELTEIVRAREDEVRTILQEYLLARTGNDELTRETVKALWNDQVFTPTEFDVAYDAIADYLLIENIREAQRGGGGAVEGPMWRLVNDLGLGDIARRRLARRSPEGVARQVTPNTWTHVDRTSGQEVTNTYQVYQHRLSETSRQIWFGNARVATVDKNISGKWQINGTGEEFDSVAAARQTLVGLDLDGLANRGINIDASALERRQQPEERATSLMRYPFDPGALIITQHDGGYVVRAGSVTTTDGRVIKLDQNLGSIRKARYSIGGTTRTFYVPERTDGSLLPYKGEGAIVFRTRDDALRALWQYTFSERGQPEYVDDYWDTTAEYVPASMRDPNMHPSEIYTLLNGCPAKAGISEMGRDYENDGSLRGTLAHAVIERMRGTSLEGLGKKERLEAIRRVIVDVWADNVPERRSGEPASWDDKCLAAKANPNEIQQAALEAIYTWYGLDTPYQYLRPQRTGTVWTKDDEPHLLKEGEAYAEQHILGEIEVEGRLIPIDGTIDFMGMVNGVIYLGDTKTGDVSISKDAKLGSRDVPGIPDGTPGLTIPRGKQPGKGMAETGTQLLLYRELMLGEYRKAGKEPPPIVALVESTKENKLAWVNNSETNVGEARKALLQAYLAKQSYYINGFPTRKPSVTSHCLSCQKYAAGTCDKWPERMNLQPMLRVSGPTQLGRRYLFSEIDNVIAAQIESERPEVAPRLPVPDELPAGVIDGPGDPTMVVVRNLGDRQEAALLDIISQREENVRDEVRSLFHIQNTENQYKPGSLRGRAIEYINKHPEEAERVSRLIMEWDAYRTRVPGEDPHSRARRILRSIDPKETRVWRDELLADIPEDKRDDFWNIPDSPLPLLAPTPGKATQAAQGATPATAGRGRTHITGEDMEVFDALYGYWDEVNNELFKQFGVEPTSLVTGRALIGKRYKDPDSKIEARGPNAYFSPIWTALNELREKQRDKTGALEKLDAEINEATRSLSVGRQAYLRAHPEAERQRENLEKEAKALEEPIERLTKLAKDYEALEALGFGREVYRETARGILPQQKALEFYRLVDSAPNGQRLLLSAKQALSGGEAESLALRIQEAHAAEHIASARPERARVFIPRLTNDEQARLRVSLEEYRAEARGFWEKRVWLETRVDPKTGVEKKDELLPTMIDENVKRRASENPTAKTLAERRAYQLDFDVFYYNDKNGLKDATNPNIVNSLSNRGAAIVLHTAGIENPDPEKYVLTPDDIPEPIKLMGTMPRLPLGGPTGVTGLNLAEMGTPGWQTPASHYGMVLINDRGMVMLYRTADGWALPRGELRVGEHPAETAMRGVRETTGIEPTTPIAMVQYQYKDAADPDVSTNFFLGTADDIAPVPPEGIEEVRWMVPGEAADLLSREGIDTDRDQKALLTAAVLHQKLPEDRSFMVDWLSENDRARTGETVERARASSALTARNAARQQKQLRERQRRFAKKVYGIDLPDDAWVDGVDKTPQGPDITSGGTHIMRQTVAQDINDNPVPVDVPLVPDLGDDDLLHMGEARFAALYEEFRSPDAPLHICSSCGNALEEREMPESGEIRLVHTRESLFEFDMTADGLRAAEIDEADIPLDLVPPVRVGNRNIEFHEAVETMLPGDGLRAYEEANEFERRLIDASRARRAMRATEDKELLERNKPRVQEAQDRGSVAVGLVGARIALIPETERTTKEASFNEEDTATVQGAIGGLYSSLDALDEEEFAYRHLESMIHSGWTQDASGNLATKTVIATGPSGRPEVHRARVIAVKDPTSPTGYKIAMSSQESGNGRTRSFLLLPEELSATDEESLLRVEAEYNGVSPNDVDLYDPADIARDIASRREFAAQRRQQIVEEFDRLIEEVYSRNPEMLRRRELIRREGVESIEAAAILSALREERPDGLGGSLEYNKNDPLAARAVDAINRFVPGNWIRLWKERHPGPLVVQDANGQRADYAEGVLTINPDDPLGVVHEFLHGLFENDQEVDELFRAFVASRTGDESPVRLRDLLPDGGFHQSELAYRDDTLEPYAYKLTEGGAGREFLPHFFQVLFGFGAYKIFNPDGSFNENNPFIRREELELLLGFVFGYLLE